MRPYGSAPSPLLAADRRRHLRYALDIPGRFMRADKLDYPCRLLDISVDGAAMTTPAILAVGENIIAYLIHLGGIEGSVVRRFPGGFAMSISATQRKRDKLARQFLRLSSKSVISEAEEREFPRVPVNEISTLILADGAALECPLLDMSRSGASIATHIRPPVGTLLMLGKRRAAVVRHHEQGIAVEFLNDPYEETGAFEEFGEGEDLER